jgi:hypothetical protein
MSFVDQAHKHGKHFPIQTPPPSTDKAKDSGSPSTPTPIGPGSAGYSGPTPPVQSPAASASTSPEYQAIVSSILAFMPAMSDDDIDVMLAAATMKMKKLEAQSDNDQVQTDSDKKRDALGAKEESLKESVQKIQDAISKQENQSIWDKIKIGFEALGAVLSIAVGILLCATGIGAVAGGLMIAAGVVGVIMTIDAICQQTTGLGIAGNCARDADRRAGRPDDPSYYAKCDMGFEIGMAVVAVALAVAGICTGVGLINAGADVAKMAEFSDTALKMARIAETANTIYSAASTVGESATDIYFAVNAYQTTNEQADAKDLQADAKRMEAVIQQLDGLIDIAMQHMKNHMAQWNGVLDSITSAMNDRNQMLIRAKLHG